MSTLERPIWKPLLTLSVVNFFTSIALMVGGLWVDPRLGWFIFFSGTATTVLAIAAGLCASDGDTYQKKPRDWRKIRRESERAAYIKQLEDELLEAES